MSIFGTLIQAVIAWIGMRLWGPSAQERQPFELTEREWARRYTELVAESRAHPAGSHPRKGSHGQRRARGPHPSAFGALAWTFGGLLALWVLLATLTGPWTALITTVGLIVLGSSIFWLIRRSGNHHPDPSQQQKEETDLDSTSSQHVVKGSTLALTCVAIATTGAIAFDALHIVAWQG